MRANLLHAIRNYSFYMASALFFFGCVVSTTITIKISDGTYVDKQFQRVVDVLISNSFHIVMGKDNKGNEKEIIGKIGERIVLFSHHESPDLEIRMIEDGKNLALYFTEYRNDKFSDLSRFIYSKVIRDLIDSFGVQAIEYKAIDKNF